MRPIGYGLLVFIASGLVWVVSSFGAAVEEISGAAAASEPWMYVSGTVFFFSLPVSIAVEIARWWKRRRIRG